MMRVYGFETFNPLKVLYTATHLELDFEYVKLDPSKGDHKTPDYMKIHPLGKVPALEHNGKYLFESGAICRYLANISKSPLYPKDLYQRALVDQWMDFFSCHLGRWLTKLFFERVIKSKAGLGEPDEKGCEEAMKFAHDQFKILDELLEHSSWIANDALSIADLFAFAYIERVRAIPFSLDDYPNVREWLDRTESLESIARARARLPS